MIDHLYHLIFPVVTITSERVAQRFFCSKISLYQREGCLTVMFAVPNGEPISYTGNRSHGGKLPNLSTFRTSEAEVLSRNHDLPLDVCKAVQQVLVFFDEPVNLKGLLPEKKVV